MSEDQLELPVLVVLGDQRLPARFWAKVQRVPSGCWIWTAATDQDGYGRFCLSGRAAAVHRVAYAALAGAIPAGLHLDHLCLNKSCCNPAHLEPVTLAENTRRAAALITSCPQGHPYDEENTVRSRRGWRACRRCLRARTARRTNPKEQDA